MQKAKHGKNTANRLFHFNADFGAELATAYNRMKEEKGSVGEDAEFQSFMETLSYVMKHK